MAKFQTTFPLGEKFFGSATAKLGPEQTAALYSYIPRRLFRIPFFHVRFILSELILIRQLPRRRIYHIPHPN